jgi:hypothetical protein
VCLPLRDAFQASGGPDHDASDVLNDTNVIRSFGYFAAFELRFKACECHSAISSNALRP